MVVDIVGRKTQPLREDAFIIGTNRPAGVGRPAPGFLQAKARPARAYESAVTMHDLFEEIPRGQLRISSHQILDMLGHSRQQDDSVR